MRHESFLAPRSTNVAPLAAAIAVAMLGLAALPARAEDVLLLDPMPMSIPIPTIGDVDEDPDILGTAVTDPTVFATLLANPDVTKRSLIDSAISVAMAAPPTQRRSFVPITTPAAGRNAQTPLRLGAGVIASTPSMMQLDGGQTLQVHADGMPDANGPDRDPLVRVMPRAVNPSDVTVGARWGAEDRIEAPLLSQIAWGAHADVLYGAPPARAGNVRRSLRITAQWDHPEDLTIGFTPGVQRGGGLSFEHYVAGFQASTVDKTQAAHWRSFVEVSGEKLSPGNLIENNTAQVHAGASYAASASTQLDISVTRGTMATSDLQSNVGLSVHF